MKKTLFSHPDITIVTLAIVFLGILIFFYSWAIGVIVTQVHTALSASPGQTAAGFDVQEAGRLDLRGLLNQSSTTSTAAAPASGSASSSQ